MRRFLPVVLSSTLLALACYAASGDHSPKTREEWKAKYQRPTSVPFPEDNQYSPAKELLGRTLFFDPRISGSGWISCASCHNPGLGWTDGLPKAVGNGMKVLGRHTPTILNSAWADFLFWDGRAQSLEEQALGPIYAQGEMGRSRGALIPTLESIRGYHALFENAFPGEPISDRTVAKAIATFERTVVSGKAPFDRWIEGDEHAISDTAKTGFDVFNGKAGCAKCHSEWNFTDNGFHDIGVKSDDIGRGKFVPIADARFNFKTPSLRDITRRAPYMHDGSESSLEQVSDFYDRGGEAKRPSLSSDIQPLHLTADEKKALIAFLETLTGPAQTVAFPELPR